MTLEEKLNQTSPINRRVATLPNLWEIREERPLNALELKKIDYVIVVPSTYDENELRGEIHFKDGTTAGKTIKFVSSSDVRLKEQIPLDELFWVHKHYIGPDEVKTTDIMHFKRIRKFDFNNPLGL